MFAKNNEEETKQTYISKHNLKRKKQAILSMFLNVKEKPYLAKRNYRLLSEVTSKNNSYSYCLNFFHSFRTINKIKSHEKSM